MVPLASKQVLDLIYWRDQVTTGLTFAAGLFVFFLCGVKGYSAITLLSYVLMGHMLARWLYRTGTSALSDLNVLEKRPTIKRADTFITAEQVQEYVPALTGLLNDSLRTSFSILYGENTASVFKCAAVLYFLSILGNMFGTTGLCFVLFLASFTMPKVYELKKAEIDTACVALANTVGQLWQQMLGKVEEVTRKTAPPKGSAAKTASDAKKKDTPKAD